MSWLEWCNAMKQKASGRITLNNLLHDFHRNRISFNKIQQFKKEIGEAWEHRSPEDEPDELMKTILNKFQDYYCCKGTIVSTHPDGYARIITAKTLKQHNLRLNMLSYNINGRLTRSQIESLSTQGIGDAGKGFMQTARNYAWITRRRDLNEYLAKIGSSGKIANKVRDVMGLQYINYDAQLTVVHYPDKALEPSDVRAPTVFDGSPTQYFRSSSPPEAPDDWGRTVNIENLSNGLPEAVHPRIPFNGGFNLEFLGEIDMIRNSIDWNKLENTMTFKWNNSNLPSELK